MNEESQEIIKNAREAKTNGEITQEQLHDVYRMVAKAEAEALLEGEL